jgi:hypothetical protein
VGAGGQGGAVGWLNLQGVHVAVTSRMLDLEFAETDVNQFWVSPEQAAKTGFWCGSTFSNLLSIHTSVVLVQTHVQYFFPTNLAVLAVGPEMLMGLSQRCTDSRGTDLSIQCGATSCCTAAVGSPTITLQEHLRARYMHAQSRKT